MVMMTIVHWSFMEFGVANIQTKPFQLCCQRSFGSNKNGWNVWNQGGSSSPDLAHIWLEKDAAVQESMLDI